MERLYQYAVVKQPTADEVKEGKRATLVVPVCPPFLARSADEVVMLATKQIPDSEMEFANRLEVAVRPF